MTNSSDKILKERTLNKIRFLENQLTSLDHYLPETYEYLMRELDLQKCTLVALEVEERFSMIDDNDKPNEPTST
jgi:hypothetical protein